MAKSAPQSGIIRVQHDTKHPYKTINTSFANDERLTWGARGLLTYLLSKPDDWKMLVKDLINQSPAGRDAVYAILKNLEECGYLERVRSRRTDGTFEYATVIYEVAQTPLTEKPEAVQPEAVQPYTEKPDIYKVRKELTKDVLTKKQSGGVARSTENAAATVDQSLVDRLMGEQMLMRDQATKAAALPCMTHEVLDRLKVWRQTMIERNMRLPQHKQKKPQAILWSCLRQGFLPDDLPAAAVVVTQESREEAIRRHLEESKKAVSYATFR